MSPISSRNIALTGFMAVGKSAVGRALAKRLKRPFVDLDKAIEKNTGTRVKEIFSQKGELYFRELEKAQLARVLQQEGQVIATGGGVVTDPENVRLLREKSFLICLTASTDVLLKRAGSGVGRPLLKGENRRERIRDLLRRRERYYGQAEVSIDTSDLTIDQIVEKIVALVGQP